MNFANLKMKWYTPLLIRLGSWEYWPFNLVYAPVFLFWIWLGIKAKTFFFFNTSNPFIKNGGFLQESKKEIYDLIPSDYCPTTLLFKKGVSEDQVLGELNNSPLHFPLIAKPDIGLRGIAVEKIDNKEYLLRYVKKSKVDFLVQNFIPFQQEAGIFYYRLPHEKNGRISGIVAKEFLSVCGDGISTIEQLMRKNPRCLLQLGSLQKTQPHILKEVLPDKELYELVPYGNHSRGAKFTDITHLADEQLNSMIDSTCKQIKGFYFGRMDIRYNTWQELKEGKNFSIIELNGAGSEPTHIYDPRHSIFFAWKEIVRHLLLLYKISEQNHRLLQMPYMKFSLGMQMLKQNSGYVKLISK